MGIVHHRQPEAGRPLHATGSERSGTSHRAGLPERRTHRLEQQRPSNGFIVLQEKPGITTRWMAGLPGSFTTGLPTLAGQRHLPRRVPPHAGRGAVRIRIEQLHIPPHTTGGMNNVSFVHPARAVCILLRGGLIFLFVEKVYLY